MGEQQERGNDAADHAPKPKVGAKAGGTKAKSDVPDKQDGANYRDLEDGKRAVPLEDMNSANDE